MSVLIKQGTIVTSVNEYVADIYVEDEKIAAIGNDLNIEANDVFDARGLYVLPGGVDQHTHFNFTYKTATVRGFETSNAALLGGTTTIVDFANQQSGKSMKESIQKYMEEKVVEKAMCDYGFHGVVFDANESLFKEIPTLPENGIPTLKLFMAYKGMPYHCKDDSVFRALLAAKESGVTIMVHAENETVDHLLLSTIEIKP